MSATSQLKKSFKKLTTKQITILKSIEESGELTALKTKTYTPLKIVNCYWKETTDSANTEHGEVQEYTGKILILTEDIQDIRTEIDQTCRIISKPILPEDTWSNTEEWIIQTITPKYSVDSFHVIEIEARLPKEGNRVRIW